MEPIIKVPEITLHLSGILSGLGLRYGWGEEHHPLVGPSVPNLPLLSGAVETDIFTLMRNGLPLFINFDAEEIIELAEVYNFRVQGVNAIPQMEQKPVWNCL